MRTAVLFMFIGSGFIAPFGVLNIRQGNVVAGVVQELCVAAMVIMTVFALPRGRLLETAFLGLAASHLTVGFGMWYGGGLSAAAIVFLPVVPLVGMLSIGRAGGAAGALGSLAVVIVVASLEKLGFAPRHDPPAQLFVKRGAESMAVVLQVWLIAQMFHDIKDRALGLLSRSRDDVRGLLDSMRQGVLAFGADGQVHADYSRKAREVFARDALEGTSVVELLYRDATDLCGEPEAFAMWIDMAFAARDEASWEELRELAPNALTLREGSDAEQHLRLEFRPIFEGGRLARIMLLVTDETDQVRLAREASKERAEKQELVQRMRRLAAGGAHTFLAFLRGAEQRLLDIAQTCASDRALDRGGIEHAFRLAHTIKGEAKSYELETLYGIVEALEHELQALRTGCLAGRAPARADLLRVAELVTGAQGAVVAARESLVEASPIGEAILDRVTVSRADVDALHEHVLRTAERSPESKLVRLANRLASRPFGEATAHLGDSISRWAAARDKRCALEVEGRDVLVPPALSEVLPAVLGHLLRNAIAHGIEPCAERTKAAKEPVGVVRVRCVATADGPCITVEDAGRAIALDELAERARRHDPQAKPALSLIFVEGLSTEQQADALSGRGVGMGAVRAELSRVGYEIDVASSPGAFTRFTLQPSPARPQAAAAG